MPFVSEPSAIFLEALSKFQQQSSRHKRQIQPVHDLDWLLFVGHETHS